MKKDKTIKTKDSNLASEKEKQGWYVRKFYERDINGSKTKEYYYLMSPPMTDKEMFWFKVREVWWIWLIIIIFVGLLIRHILQS